MGENREYLSPPLIMEDVMRRCALGLLFALGSSSVLFAQGPGHTTQGALPGFHTGPHFGDGPGPGQFAPGAALFIMDKSAASAQTGTGRLGGDTMPGNASAKPFTTGWQPLGGDLRRSFSAREGRKENEKDGEGVHGKPKDGDRDADDTQGKRKKNGDHDADDRSKLTGPARALQERLAAIDHMRDQALKSGNTRLLQEADVLEAKARQQYIFQMEHGNRSTADTPKK